MATDTRQVRAIEAWFALRNGPDFISASPEARYEARLSLADDMRARGIIDSEEWSELVEEATTAYAEELG